MTTKLHTARCKNDALTISSGESVELPTFFPRRLHRQRLHPLAPNPPSAPDNPLTTKFPPDLVHLDSTNEFFNFFLLHTLFLSHCRSYAIAGINSPRRKRRHSIPCLIFFFFKPSFGHASRPHPFSMTNREPLLTNHFSR